MMSSCSSLSLDIYLVKSKPADEPLIGVRAPLEEMARENTIVSVLKSNLKISFSHYNAMDPSNMEIWIFNPSPRLLRQAKKLALIYPDRSLDALHFWTVKHSVNIYIHGQSRIF